MPSVENLFVPNLSLVEHHHAVIETDSEGLPGNEVRYDLATGVISIQTIDEVLRNVDERVWL